MDRVYRYANGGVPAYQDGLREEYCNAVVLTNEEYDTLRARLDSARELLRNTVPILVTVKLPEHTMPEDLTEQEFHNISVLQLRAWLAEDGEE